MPPQADPVNARVDALLDDAAPRVRELTGPEREAARLLFSVLSYLEHIAVLAAERGDCIEGQLEDELVHKAAFTTLARALGGREPAPASVAELVEFVSSLRGTVSLALLNVTAEAWLERTLHRLASAGLCNGLFASIEADEARHAAAARALPKPDPTEAGPLMAKLERLLADITREPDFILPLIHFLGQNESARLTLDIIRAHREACGHLGVVPTRTVFDLRRAMKEIVLTREPQPVALGAWERSRLEVLEHKPAPMLHQFDVRWERSGKDLEAELARAVSWALERLPRCHRTFAAGRLYQCQDPLVGLRRLYSPAGQVFTVYARAPHKRSFDAVRAALADDAGRARRQPYCQIPELRRYEGLLPAPRASAVITNVAAFGEVERGFAPLVPTEGASVVIATSSVRERPRPFLRWLTRWERYTTINLLADHRVMDGREIIELSNAIKSYLENVNGA